MNQAVQIAVDRSDKASLAGQIHRGIAAAIREGRLSPGARLPSWQDLATQLGVARGTVRVAYERLADEQLVLSAGPAGTHVAEHPVIPPKPDWQSDRAPLAGMFPDYAAPPAAFQMGVPAQDAFPVKLWSRIMVRAARSAAAAPVSYPDPRGDPGLRHEIAAYLAIARGIACQPPQVIVTSGYAGALGLAIRALELENTTAWMEEPGFPITRAALKLARIAPIPVRVDAEGLDVADGVATAPDAALAIVTAGQQAPLGMTLSLARRRAFLAWAGRSGAWIIEDDYLSELQLRGRAAPALASLDTAGRVIHIGSFSKTISPALRLGFLVAPPSLAAHFGEVAACLSPAPGPAVQRAVTEFMRDGHYLRHLRRMKRLYAVRRDALVAQLREGMQDCGTIELAMGLGVLLRLPETLSDVDLAARALPYGLAPVPLSLFHAVPGIGQAGLLLGVSNISLRTVAASCARLERLVRQQRMSRHQYDADP